MGGQHQPRRQYHWSAVRKCLHADCAGTANDTKIVVWTCSGAAQPEMLTYSSNLLSQTYPEQLADSARHALELVANDTVPIDVTGR